MASIQLINQLKTQDKAHGIGYNSILYSVNAVFGKEYFPLKYVFTGHSILSAFRTDKHAFTIF
jgi:hypothetical protein